MRRQNHFIILIFIIFSLSLPLLSGQATAQTYARYEQVEGGEQIELTVGHATPNVFFLENPNRLVVDVATGSLPKLNPPDGSDLIRAVRVGRHNPTTVRIVFDLAKPCKLVESSHEGGKLVLHITAGSGSKNAPIAVKPAAQKPLIVIDPGHGGQDPGALGPRGTKEKEVVLAIAKQLRDALVKTGQYRVKLTREDDRFIMLRERVAAARKAGGSLFISIHADSAPSQHNARGLSVYTLSEKSSDAEAEALAERENKSDIIGGMDLSHEQEDVADILISLAQRDTRHQSAMLADHLVGAMQGRLPLLANPHRFAGFAVLKAPDIPSVLIETGFISHKEEEKLLQSKHHRQRLVEGIVTGIKRYYERRSATPP